MRFSAIRRMATLIEPAGDWGGAISGFFSGAGWTLAPDSAQDSAPARRARPQGGHRPGQGRVAPSHTC